MTLPFPRNMPRKNPPRIGARMAKRYRWLRYWGKRWEKMPDRMERSRQLNVAKAHEKAKAKTDMLRGYIEAWPRKMTKAEFVARLKADAESGMFGNGLTRKGYDWKSYRARLVRLGFCSFDKLTKTWTNHVARPVDFRREMCDTDAP